MSVTQRITDFRLKTVLASGLVTQTGLCLSPIPFLIGTRLCISRNCSGCAPECRAAKSSACWSFHRLAHRTVASPT